MLNWFFFQYQTLISKLDKEEWDFLEGGGAFKKSKYIRKISFYNTRKLQTPLWHWILFPNKPDKMVFQRLFMYYYQIRRIFSFFLALFKTFYVYFHIYVLIFSTIFQTIDDGPWEKGVWHLTDCSIKIMTLNSQKLTQHIILYASSILQYV